MPSKWERRLSGEVYVPDLTALVEKAGVEGAKRIAAELSDVARQIGEVGDSLLRKLGDVEQALGGIASRVG